MIQFRICICISRISKDFGHAYLSSYLKCGQLNAYFIFVVKMWSTEWMNNKNEQKTETQNKHQDEYMVLRGEDSP